MKLLVLVHVLSAIIGVGPTFFGHVLLRRNQSINELRHSMATAKKLEMFPKIGGSVAVLSGVALILIGGYGSFLQLWQIGSLILYILIQIVVIAFLAPRAGKLAAWLFHPENHGAAELPSAQQALFASASRIQYVATTLGAVLFIFMILKP